MSRAAAGKGHGMTYLDPDDHDPDDVRVMFTEEQTRRAFAIAEGYARYCLDQGRPPPAHPLLAVLEAAEAMKAYIDQQHGLAMLAEWGGAHDGRPN